MREREIEGEERRKRRGDAATPTPSSFVTSLSDSSFSALPAAVKPFQREPVHRLILL